MQLDNRNLHLVLPLSNTIQLLNSFLDPLNVFHARVLDPNIRMGFSSMPLDRLRRI